MEPVSLAIEGASLIVAVIPLALDMFRNLRNRSKYASAQEIVETQKKLLEDIYWKTKSGDWERVIKLLDVGDVMMPFVIERLKRRFILLLAIALPIGGVSAVTFHPQAGVTTMNVVDAVLLLANGFFVLFNWQAVTVKFLQEYLFNSEEKEFLENVSLLHDAFYNYSVREAIKVFNRSCKGSDRLKARRKAQDEEIKKLKAAFQAYLTEGGSMSKFLP